MKPLAKTLGYGFLFLLLILGHTNVQAQLIGNTRNIKVDDTPVPVTSDNSYNILTGEKFEQDELNTLIRNKPNVYMEEVYDKYGEVESFWFNPNRVMGPPTTMGRTPTGGEFPDFVFKTTDGEVFDTEDIKDTWFILRFEGFPENFMFKKQEVMELDSKINDFKQSGEKIMAFDIYYWKEERAKEIFTAPNSNFRIVADAHRFCRKFKIIRTPNTLVINPEGILMGYYKHSEDIDLFDLKKE